MTVFLITPAGEEGPLTPAQINRLHAQGKAKPDQLCRVEGSTIQQPLQDVFKHLAPREEAVVAARRQVAAYNRAAGSASAKTGGILIVIGFFCFFIFNPLNISFGLWIVGLILITQGGSQRRRGEVTQQAPAANPSPQPTPTAKTSEEPAKRIQSTKHEDPY